MQHTARILLVGLLLGGATPTCQALMVMKSLTKAQAEQELGVVMKRENLGLGAATNEAGISIAFSPTGKLENFLYVQLDVYSVFPTQMSNGVMAQRRLASATLKPTIETTGKVRAFFTVDPEYLDRTEVSVRVRARNSTDPDGYDIRLNAKDFAVPQPAQSQRTSHTANAIKMAQGKFTGGIGTILIMDSGHKLPVIKGVLPNSPAEKAGLQMNDIILKINGTATNGRLLKDIVDAMRGFIGTTVTLTVQRGATNLDCVVHRTSWDNLQVEPPPLWDDKFPAGLPTR